MIECGHVTLVWKMACFDMSLRKQAHATYGDFFTAVKMIIFRCNFHIYLIFAQNKDGLWVRVRTASCFRAKLRK